MVVLGYLGEVGLGLSDLVWWSTGIDIDMFVDFQ